MNLPICMLGLTTMLVTTAPMLGRAETLVRVEGTEFVLTTAEGVTLRSADLQGATLKIRIAGRDIPVRVERVEEDADAVGGRVVLHHFVVRNENGITVDCASLTRKVEASASQYRTGAAALNSPAPAAPSGNASAGAIASGRTASADRRCKPCIKLASAWCAPITAATAKP
jgi:hypothetical protein